MERKDIFEKLTVIFRDVLDNELIVLSDNTTSEDIEEWDSLSHVQLVAEIEHEFDIRFTSAEIMSWSNVGHMVDTIINKR